MKFFLKYFFMIAVILLPMVSFADKITAEDMKKTCLDGFMKDADQTSDPAMYKSYINKVCDCSAIKIGGQEVADSSMVMVAMGTCMRVSLLTESMNSLKDDDSLSEDKITTACQKEWQVFTSLKKDQGTQEKFCGCAAKKIMSLDASKRTDETSLNQVSVDCPV